MGEIELELLSVKELLDLQARIHTAIRAIIRARNERSGSGMSMAPLPVAKIAEKVDLESERNAWLAARKKGT